MKFWSWLHAVGIDITLMFAGMMGSVLMAARKTPMDIKKSILGVISGTLSANYLTQVVIHICNLEGRSQYGVAFLLGYFGLKGVERYIEVHYKDKAGK